MDPFSVVFLGSGDAFFAGGRHQSAYLVHSPDTTFMLDCAPTALSSLKRHGLSADPVDTIFLSHLHGDHYAGLPFFFLEYTYIEPRRRPLTIVGPPEVEKRVRLLFSSMYSEDAAKKLPFEIEFIEAHPKKCFSVGDVSVEPFRAPHQKQPVSLGYCIEVNGRKILYSGDSGWTEDLVTHSEGADLFICECSYYETQTATHLDYPSIQENRNRFKAKRIILTHLGREVLNHRDEIDMELAYDGMVVTI
jgi:ribonuclease BN (tRNA processing enzyme)